MTTTFDEADLMREYTPLLVLYPEIPPGTERVQNTGYPHEAPLSFDYHPRDIKMVLEHSSLYLRFRLSRGRTSDWRTMLDRMEKVGYRKHLDLMPTLERNDRAGFWEAYAAIPKDREEYRHACYARTVRGVGVVGNRILAQYWYAYFYNDFWNTHEMDWEVVMIVFKLTDEGPKPTLCAYSAHLGGHWLKWADVEKADEGGQRVPEGTHPVVYVANGSHANYFYGSGLYLTAPPLISMAASMLRESRRLVDYTIAFEDGARHLVEAQQVPPSQNGQWTGDWRWLNQKRGWGSPGEFLDLEFGDSGPKGPPQGGQRWDYPFRWIDTCCTMAPPRGTSVVPTMLEPES